MWHVFGQHWDGCCKSDEDLLYSKEWVSLDSIFLKQRLSASHVLSLLNPNWHRVRGMCLLIGWFYFLMILTHTGNILWIFKFNTNIDAAHNSFTENQLSWYASHIARLRLFFICSFTNTTAMLRRIAPGPNKFILMWLLYSSSLWCLKLLCKY